MNLTMMQLRRGIHPLQQTTGRTVSFIVGAQTGLPDDESPSCPFRKTLSQLEEPNRRIGNPAYASLVRWCGDQKALSDGRRVHAHICANGQDRNTFLSNLLVQMYGKCGSVEDAWAVFNKIRQPDLYSWTLMIAACALNGQGAEALELSRKMQKRGVKPNKITFIHLLTACASTRALAEGKWIHERILANGFECDATMGNALVNMYGKCGSPRDARLVFDKMYDRNVISWTAMIAAYAQNGQGKEAIGLFRQMQREGIKPDQVTFISILDACANLASLASANAIHELIVASGFESDVAVMNALINIYGKCGSPKDARLVFDKMHERDVISWNAMIAAYVQNGQGKEAFKLFQQMDMGGVNPDIITFLTILNACADLVSLDNGKAIHERIVASGFESDVTIRNSLINMYGKCGSVENAKSVFDRMHERDLISWNAMVAAYAHNGQCKDALELFQQMDVEGVKPDRVTFLSVLKACSHAGLLNEGWEYFISMSGDYGIAPSVEHYVCVIDLFGRAGCLDEAEDLINTMPVQPSVVAWSALLNACRIHGDVKRGALAAECVSEFEPSNASPYLSLFHIYTTAGKWDDAAKVKTIMEERGLKKHLECCWIVVNNIVRDFSVGETSHPQSDELYAELQRLYQQMEEAGYMPKTNVALCDPGLGKDHKLCHHSEKLAVAFGLIATPCGTPLRIFKNLRVCSDCHVATKLISQIVGRQIILRDANCLHHFKHGACSCGDLW